MTDEGRTVATGQMRAGEWSSVRFTILYEYPFWIGVLEAEVDGNLGAARHIFGVEPTSAEVGEFVRRGFVRLLKQATGSPITVDADHTNTRRATSPRRATRQAAQATAIMGISREAQEALRVQQQERSELRQVERELATRHKLEQEKLKLREKRRGH